MLSNLGHLKTEYESGVYILRRVMWEVARCVECKEGSPLAEAVISQYVSKSSDGATGDIYREFGKAFKASLEYFVKYSTVLQLNISLFFEEL